MKLLAGTTLAIYSLASSTSAQEVAADPCTDLSTTDNIGECVSFILNDLENFQNGSFNRRFERAMNKMIRNQVSASADGMMEEVEAKLAGASNNGPDMEVNGNVYISYGDDEQTEETEEVAYDAAAHLADQEAGLRDYWDFDDMPADTIKEIMLQRFFEKQACVGQIAAIVDAEMYAGHDGATPETDESLSYWEGYTDDHNALMEHWAAITEPLGPGWQMGNLADFMAAYGEAWANDFNENMKRPGSSLSALYKDDALEMYAEFFAYKVHSLYVYCDALPNMIRPNKFDHDPWHPSVFSGVEEYSLLDDIAHSRFFEKEQCHGQVWNLFLAEISELFALPTYNAEDANAIKQHWSEVMAGKTELYGSWFADSDWIDFFSEHGRAWANAWVAGYNGSQLVDELIDENFITAMALGHPYWIWMQFKYCDVLPNVLRVSNLKHGIEYSEGDYVLGQEQIHGMDETMDFYN